MTTSWPARSESGTAAAALLAAAGIAAVIRGHLSGRDGQFGWTDAICRNPFDADEQKAALEDVASALRSLEPGSSNLQSPLADGFSASREKVGGRMEITWCSAPRVFLGCASSPESGSRFVALWHREPADLARHKDLMRVAISYEMVLLRRSDSARSAVLAAKIATQTLNSLAIPLFVVGSDREILRMNSAARNWLISDGRLRLANARLVGASAVLNAQLRAAVGRATSWSAPSLAIVPLADPADDSPAVTLSCAPMPEPKGHVLIAVQERRCDLNLAQQTLTALGLTQSERRLASFLGTGMSLQKAAGASGITFSTARSYLKRIFGKLGIARQSDLVGLVAALTPIFLGEDAARSEPAGAQQHAADPDDSHDGVDGETAPFRRFGQDLSLVVSDPFADSAGMPAASEAPR